MRSENFALLIISRAYGFLAKIKRCLFLFLGSLKDQNLVLIMNFELISFLFLVLIVRFFVLCYIRYYIKNEINLSSYIFLILIFILSIVGLLCRDSWITLFMRWEGLGVSRFFLILYYGSWESYNNAFVTLMIIRRGEWTFFIFVTGRIFQYIGSLSLSFFLETLTLMLFIICITKRALFPFSLWLPKAMSAPTPTRALVHSSTLVTAGLVLLIKYRLIWISSFFLSLALVSGFLTILVGRGLGLIERRVKKLVAYRTMSQIGLCMLVYGMGNLDSGFLNLIAHGIAKSLLFMQVGYLIHGAFSRQDWRVWSFGRMTGVIQLQVLISLISLCGTSFHSGILCKEVILRTAHESPWRLVQLIFIVLILYSTFLYSIVIYKTLFMGYIGGVSIRNSSLLMLLVTLLEGVAVLSFIHWLFMNYVIIPRIFNFSEILSPLLVIVILIIIFQFISSILLFFKPFSSFLSFFERANYYNWFYKPFGLFGYLENIKFSLNSSSYLWFFIFSQRINSFNVFNRNFMLLVVILVLLLV